MRPLLGYEAYGYEAFELGDTQPAFSFVDGSVAHLDWKVGWAAASVDSGFGDRKENARALMSALEERTEFLERVRESLPGIGDLEAAIGIPATEWASRCFEIATKVLESGVLDQLGSEADDLHAVYGQYFGEIDEKSVFAGRPVVRHGWIESGTGLVIDPTRFVFEARKPYLWCGSNMEYDLGGQRMKEAMRRPAPEFSDINAVKLNVSDRERLEVFDRLLAGQGRAVETGHIGQAQLYWIGSLSLERLGDDVASVYDEIVSLGRRSLVPIDLMKWYEEVLGSQAQTPAPQAKF